MQEDMNTAEIQRALLVRMELGEVISRLQAEGMEPQVILAGTAAMLNDFVANASNQAVASAYFFGLAKQAAHLAAKDLPS